MAIHHVKNTTLKFNTFFKYSIAYQYKPACQHIRICPCNTPHETETTFQQNTAYLSKQL